MPLKNKQYMMFSLAGAGTLIYKGTMIGTEIKTVLSMPSLGKEEAHEKVVFSDTHHRQCQENSR